MAGTLDSLGHFLLILVGSTGDAAGQNLALLIDKLQQEVSIFIVNIFDAEFFETTVFLTLGLDGNRGEIFNFGFVSHDSNVLKCCGDNLYSRLH